MYKGKSVTALIPAKGTSSLKNKNLRILDGKHLIYYSIDPAKSKLIDEIVVITDSVEVGRFAQIYGSTKTLDIPPELTVPGANAALRFAADSLNFDIAVYLQPTDLFKNTDWIEECITNLVDSNNSCVFIGSKEHKNYWSNNSVPFREPDDHYANRQIKPYIIREDTGLGCAIRKDVLTSSEFPVEDRRARIGLNPRILVKEYRFFDIHDEMDLFLAEQYLEKCRVQNISAHIK